MTLRFLSLACVLALVAGCSGRMGSSSALPPALGDAAASAARAAAPQAKGSGRLIVTVRIAHPSSRVSPHYVSPATKGMTLKITGPTNVTQTAGLIANAGGCVGSLVTLDCTVTVSGLAPCPNAHDCYTASVATYNEYQAANNTIPHGAKVLSANDDFKFTIQTGGTVVPLVLEGLPKSVAFFPSATSKLAGTQSAGFIDPKCPAKPQSVTALGVDAAGDYIVGPGEPKITVVSDDPAQLKVNAPHATTPNQFVLVPPKAPAYAFGGHTIHLTVTATPVAASGGTAATATVPVTYSGDICGAITEYTIPTSGSQPYGIVPGPDGNLWFTENVAGKIGRITTAGTITEFPTPSTASGPEGIAPGADGNLWFAESSIGKIGKITTAGSAVEYATTTAGSGPANIVTGPDNNLWFTEQNVSKIGTITTAGSVTEYPVTASSGPYGITSDGGQLWYTEFTSGEIGSITTAGLYDDHTLLSPHTLPVSIVADTNGALWFTECAGAIGQITSGTNTAQYPTPEAASAPLFITAGADGAMYFTEAVGNRIGRIAPGGVFTEYAIPTVSSEPFQIALGPDGALWFTELNGNKIASLR